MALQILDRLWEKTRIDETTNCWLYEGGNDSRKGYGRIRFNGIKKATHRVSAYLFLGLDLLNPILQALHKPICPNKNCWNPEHLYIGTHNDNVQDTINSGVLQLRKRANQKHRRKSA